MAPVDDAFSGDRMGVLRDPFGVRWCVARHDRDVPDADRGRRPGLELLTRFRGRSRSLRS